MKYIFITIFLFIFTGCQSTAIQNFSQHNQSISKTKKVEITQDERRFLIIATHINEIKHANSPKDRYEHFIVSFYEAGENPYKKPILGAKIDDEEASWEFADLSSPLVQIVSTTNSWSQYYHIKAPKSTENRVKLEVIVDENRSAVLTFVKDPA